MELIEILNDPDIKKVNVDMYITSHLNKSMEVCKALSISDNDLFSVVYGYSETLKKNVFYIERGLPIIRNFETLVCEYEKGIKIR